MRRLGEWYRRARFLIQRDRLTAELEEEMRLHVQLRADRLHDEGLDTEEAIAVARRRFGNSLVLQERSRDMWGLQWIEHVIQDLRFAIRRLRSRPGFSLPAIAVTALGIGATAAVFSAVDAAILRPLPFARPSELVTLTDVAIPDSRAPGGTGTIVSVVDAAAMPELFSSAAAYAAGGLNLDDPVAPRRLNAGVVTANFFSTLEAMPERGRAFAPEEGRPGGPRVAIVSDGLWRSHFSAHDTLGATLSLSGKPYQVIGVMPPSFGFPSGADVWIPLAVPTSAETYAPFRGYLPSTVIARLAPGVTIDAAARRLLARWTLLQGPAQPNAPRRATAYLDRVTAAGAAVSLQQEILGDRRTPLLTLLGATLLLLLIAAANVANLLLSDGASRGREVALREVLGASRGRVIRQLLVESLLLALTGAALGLALAPLTLNILRALMPEDLAGTAPIHIDLRVLGFATVLSVVTGIVFGLSPALGTSRVNASETIKSGDGHGTTSGKLGHTRRLLIAAELALTVMLLVGSGLMLKSFHRLMSQDLGMNPGTVGTLELAFGRAAADTSMPGGVAGQRRLKLHAILDRLSADPAIQAAGVVNDLPLRGTEGIGISIAPIGTPRPSHPAFPRYLIASGGYFSALGIPLLEGRTFNARDDSTGERAAIVNRTMAALFWPARDALGHQFYFGGDTTVAYTVVGVVADVREGTLDTEVKPQMYFSFDERSMGNAAIVARSTLPPSALLARITSAVRAVAPQQAVFNVRMMDEVVDHSVAPRKINTLLIAIFGGLALVLSAFGVYAVVSYSVTRRARELGIRAALGATRLDLLALVSSEMAVLVGIGLAVGLGGAWMLSRVLSSLLFDVPTHDLGTFAAVPVVLVLPVIVATAVPAWRAMRGNLTAVMRSD